MTTSKDLDEIRERFTFSMSSIKAYQLGMAQHGKIPEPSLPNFSPQNLVVDKDISEGKSCREGIKTIEEEIIKLQAVLIDIVERVQVLEHSTLLLTQQRKAIPDSPGICYMHHSKKRRGPAN